MISPWLGVLYHRDLLCKKHKQLFVFWLVRLVSIEMGRWLFSVTSTIWRRSTISLPLIAFWVWACHWKMKKFFSLFFFFFLDIFKILNVCNTHLPGKSPAHCLHFILTAEIFQMSPSAIVGYHPFLFYLVFGHDKYVASGSHHWHHVVIHLEIGRGSKWCLSGTI